MHQVYEAVVTGKVTLWNTNEHFKMFTMTILKYVLALSGAQ